MWLHQSAVIVNAFDFTDEIKTNCFPRRGKRLENQRLPTLGQPILIRQSVKDH